jgi:hypothetical protein
VPLFAIKRGKRPGVPLEIAEIAKIRVILKIENQNLTHNTNGTDQAA